ncbi:MAG: hypothetical protein J5970_02265 [Bacilli bacterium]|nr:hypothetical protein [Bacilli bacterium]
MLSLLLSLIVTMFLIIKFNLEPLYLVVILVLGSILINYSLKHSKKKYNKLSIITSIVLSIIYVICDSLEKTSFINIFNRYLLLNLSGYFVIFYFSITNLFMFIDKYKKNKIEDKKIYIGNLEILSTSRFSFLVNFILFFLINILFLIKFYPGLLTYDSYNELMQAKGVIPLMNNHSILHSSILMLFVKFGLLFKSVNIGVFLFLIFQTALVSLTFSYILYFMAKEKVPVLFRVFAALFFLFHPINIFYTISLWKDVLFSLSFIIYSILIYYYSKDKDYFNNKKNIIIFIIVSLLVMYFRNNGVYVVILSLLVLFILNRSNYKKILPIFLSIIGLFFISKLIIFNALNIKDYEIKETLSFPSQSIARIYKYDNNKLTNKEKKEIEKFYSKKIGEVYKPIISDNTKNELKQEYLLKHKGDYLKLNFKLFFKYNKRYLESFINNNYGYYYMNTYYPSIIIDQTDEQGIKHAHIDFLFVMLFLVLIVLFVLLTLLWNLKNKSNILLFGLLIPVALSMPFKIHDNALVSLLFNIGFYVTITFLTLLYNIKNKNNIWYYIPVIILWVSILFSPVFAEFRYLYPVFLLIPVFIGLTMKKVDD